MEDLKDATTNLAAQFLSSGNHIMHKYQEVLGQTKTLQQWSSGLKLSQKTWKLWCQLGKESPLLTIGEHCNHSTQQPPCAGIQCWSLARFNHRFAVHHVAEAEELEKRSRPQDWLWLHSSCLHEACCSTSKQNSVHQKFNSAKVNCDCVTYSFYFTVFIHECFTY